MYLSKSSQISALTNDRSTQTSQFLSQVSELETFVEKLTNENKDLREENATQMQFITEVSKCTFCRVCDAFLRDTSHWFVG